VALLAASVQLRRSTQLTVACFRIGRDVERLAAEPARLAVAFRLGYRFGRGDRAGSS